MIKSNNHDPSPSRSPMSSSTLSTRTRPSRSCVSTGSPSTGDSASVIPSSEWSPSLGASSSELQSLQQQQQPPHSSSHHLPSPPPLPTIWSSSSSITVQLTLPAPFCWRRRRRTPSPGRGRQAYRPSPSWSPLNAGFLKRLLQALIDVAGDWGKVCLAFYTLLGQHRVLFVLWIMVVLSIGLPLQQCCYVVAVWGAEAQPLGRTSPLPPRRRQLMMRRALSVDPPEMMWKRRRTRQWQPPSASPSPGGPALWGEFNTAQYDPGKVNPNKGTDDCPSMIDRLDQYLHNNNRTTTIANQSNSNQNNSSGTNAGSGGSGHQLGSWWNPCASFEETTAPPGASSNDTNDWPPPLGSQAPTFPNEGATGTDSVVQLVVLVALRPKEKSLGAFLGKIITKYLALLAQSDRYDFSLNPWIAPLFQLRNWTRGSGEFTTGSSSDRLGQNSIRTRWNRTDPSSRRSLLVTLTRRLESTASGTLPPQTLPATWTGSPTSTRLATTGPPSPSPTLYPTAVQPLVHIQYDGFQIKKVERDSERWWWQYTISYSCYYEYYDGYHHNYSDYPPPQNSSESSAFNDTVIPASNDSSWTDPGTQGTSSPGGSGTGVPPSEGGPPRLEPVVDPVWLAQISHDLYHLLSPEEIMYEVMSDLSTFTQRTVLGFGVKELSNSVSSQSPGMGAGGAPSTVPPTWRPSSAPAHDHHHNNSASTMPPDDSTPLDTDVWDARRYVGLALFLWTCVGTMCLNRLAAWRRRRQVQKESWSGLLLATEEGVDDLLRLGWRIQDQHLQVYDKSRPPRPRVTGRGDLNDDDDATDEADFVLEIEYAPGVLGTEPTTVTPSDTSPWAPTSWESRPAAGPQSSSAVSWAD